MKADTIRQPVWWRITSLSIRTGGRPVKVKKTLTYFSGQSWRDYEIQQ